MVSPKGCLLCCLVLVVFNVGTSGGSLSRHKRFDAGILIDGLQNAFDNTVDSVLGLASNEFDALLDRIGRVAKGTVRLILNNFRLFSNQHQDLSGVRGQKLHRIMEALNGNIQRTDEPAGSALPGLSVAAAAFSLLTAVMLV